MHHVGEYPGYPKDIAAKAIESAANIAMPVFDVAFDRAMSFSTKAKSRPVVLCGGAGVADLIAFHGAFGSAMQQVGLGRAKSSYTPHITLLYDERTIDEHPVEPIRWTAREFVLIHSLLGRGEYRVLGRWPLRGGPQRQPFSIS